MARQYRLKPADLQAVTRQADLHGLLPLFLAQIFGHLVLPGNGNQLGFQALTEDTGLLVALHTGKGAPA